MGGTTGSIASTRITGHGAIAFQRSDNFTYRGTVSGGGVIQAGSGTLFLTGPNSYDGTTVVKTGALAITHAQSIGTSGIAVDGGTLDLRGHGLTVATLSGTGSTGKITSSTPDALTLIVNQDVTTAFAGGIDDGAGTVSVLKRGNGLLIMSGSSSYTRPTTIADGMIGFSAAGLSSGTIVLANGGLQWLEGNTSDISAHLAPLSGTNAIGVATSASVVEVPKPKVTWKTHKVVKAGNGRGKKIG